jgi:hypothetical protein
VTEQPLWPGADPHRWPDRERSRRGPLRTDRLSPGRYTRDVMFGYRLSDGRIIERWAIRDDLAMILALED